MRTFHTGGVVGEDITHGLPRVVELFEARTPKGAAVLAHHSGVVRIDDEEGGRRITVVADDGAEESVLVNIRAHLEVKAGQEVAAGDALVEGPKDPRSCSRSRASERPSSTWWKRSRRSTGTRVCPSTTSTSS
jgi:DNA-directed RNA polymerase subunit beta'